MGLLDMLHSYEDKPPEVERTLTVGLEAIVYNLEEAGRDIEQVLCTDQLVCKIRFGMRGKRWPNTGKLYLIETSSTSQWTS